MEMIYKCPTCYYDMEEVEFSDGHVRPDGEPGLLCHECGLKLTVDDLWEDEE